MKGRLSLALLAVLGLGVAACHADYPTCYVGDYQVCQCPGGAGYQACLVDQSGFGACECGRIPGLDAGSDACGDGGCTR